MPTIFNPKNQDDSGVPDKNDDALWELLSVYADGEASPEEAAKVEALLRSDPSYAREFEFLHLASMSAKSYIEVDPPVTLRDTIFAATIRKQTFSTRMALAWDSFRNRIVPRYFVPFAAAGAAALIVAVVWTQKHPTGSSSTEPSQVAVNLPVAPPAEILTPSISTQSTIGQSELSHTMSCPTPDVRSIRPDHENEAGLHLASLTLPVKSKKEPQRVVKNALPPEGQNRTGTPVPHDDGTVQTAAYVPNMDAQNQRPSAQRIPSNVETEAGPDVKLPEFAKQDPIPPGKTDPPPVKITYAHLSLPSVPPDPKQILTRADLERRHSALTDGYDRSTIRSMERKETTISFFKGSF